MNFLFEFESTELIKGLRWIPRHSKTMKGVKINEKLREAENKH